MIDNNICVVDNYLKLKIKCSSTDESIIYLSIIKDIMMNIKIAYLYQ